MALAATRATASHVSSSYTTYSAEGANNARRVSRKTSRDASARARLSAACANESARLAVAASPRARLCLHQNTTARVAGTTSRVGHVATARAQNSRATAARAMSSLANPEGPHAHAVTTETTSKPSRSDVFVATSRSSSPRRALEPYMETATASPRVRSASDARAWYENNAAPRSVGESDANRSRVRLRSSRPSRSRFVDGIVTTSSRH